MLKILVELRGCLIRNALTTPHPLMTDRCLLQGRHRGTDPFCVLLFTPVTMDAADAQKTPVISAKPFLCNSTSYV